MARETTPRDPIRAALESAEYPQQSVEHTVPGAMNQLRLGLVIVTPLRSAGRKAWLVNGFDRNGTAGWRTVRTSAIRGRRATAGPVLWPSCTTGYRNPDTLACMNPSAAYWVEGTGFPNASTACRNTLFTNGTNTFDVSLFKSFAVRERRRLEFRWETQNAFNHPQFVQVPQRDVFNTLPGRFLNRDFTDSGIRSMWVQVKLRF